jgi:hypothetical protein
MSEHADGDNDEYGRSRRGHTNDGHRAASVAVSRCAPRAAGCWLALRTVNMTR